MRSTDVALLILRLGLAIVIFPHGAQKALGIWDGPGIPATVGFLGQMGVPALLAYCVIAAEFLGPIALVLGVLTRLAAFGITVDMVVAAILVHAKYGFFLNFSGKQGGEGVEFIIPIVAIGLALMIAGPGRFGLMKRF